MMRIIYLTSHRMQYLFQEVAMQFQSLNQYEKFIKEAGREFDIKIYRLHLFTVQHALLVYRQQCQKYENNLVGKNSRSWHENERRLFVWFIVCYINYKLVDANKLLDTQKHWNHIRQVFWEKDVFFLKYQLQTIIKNRGRTIWKAEEDQLLKQIYPKHQKGYWNEIAKDFYHQSRGEFFKTPKQCRERWQNHLNNGIKKGEWTQQQDLVLFQEVKKNGTKWAKIIPLLNNIRTQHMIKNRYKSLLTRVMQENNLNQNEAIDAIIRKFTDGTFQAPPKNGKMKKQGENEESDSELVIQLFESEVFVDEACQKKEEAPVKKQSKRGRPKLPGKNSMETSRGKSNQATKTEMKQQKKERQQKYSEIQGCKLVGTSMERLNQYLYVNQKSDTISHSNSIAKSYGNHGIFASSGKFAPNYSLNFSEKSLLPLDQFTIREDRNDSIRKLARQNESLRSFKTIVRPNDSLLYNCMI